MNIDWRLFALQLLFKKRINIRISVAADNYFCGSKNDLLTNF